MIIFKEFFSSI